MNNHILESFRLAHQAGQNPDSSLETRTLANAIALEIWLSQATAQPMTDQAVTAYMEQVSDAKILGNVALGSVAVRYVTETTLDFTVIVNGEVVASGVEYSRPHAAHDIGLAFIRATNPGNGRGVRGLSYRPERFCTANVLCVLADKHQEPCSNRKPLKRNIKRNGKAAR